MKVFFDTNVYVAEALLGHVAEEMIAATCKADWRIFVGKHVLNEVVSVLANQKGFSFRFASLTCQRILRRSVCVEPPVSRHHVLDDERDSPILQAALAASVDYLINLGPAATIINSTAPITFSLGNIGGDLTTLFGSWTTRGEVLWSVSGVQKIAGNGFTTNNTMFATRSDTINAPLGTGTTTPWTIAR